MLDNASYYGRIFARSGGVSDAVAEAVYEQGLNFTVKAMPCDGIEACRMALLKASRGVKDFNFIEGMACTGGCIGGAGCLTHGPKDKGEIDRYGMEAMEKRISDTITLRPLGRQCRQPVPSARGTRTHAPRAGGMGASFRSAWGGGAGRRRQAHEQGPAACGRFGGRETGKDEAGPQKGIPRDWSLGRVRAEPAVLPAGRQGENAAAGEAGRRTLRRS